MQIDRRLDIGTDVLWHRSDAASILSIQPNQSFSEPSLRLIVVPPFIDFSYRCGDQARRSDLLDRKGCRDCCKFRRYVIQHVASSDLEPTSKRIPASSNETRNKTS